MQRPQNDRFAAAPVLKKSTTPTSMSSSTWDPRAVQAQINSCYARNEEPGLLILGRKEADALRDYLRPLCPSGEDVTLKGFEYQGLHVVLLSVDNCLRVETATTIFFASRHAAEKKKKKKKASE